MLTAVRRIRTDIPANLPEVEYPYDVVERWDKEFEIARMQFATGEIVPQTAAEMAAGWEKPKRPLSEFTGILKGKVWMADDFDAPLEEFAEYM